MEIIELSEENIVKYTKYLGEDMAENIGRTFFRGIIAVDEAANPLSGLVFEYKNLNSDSDCESHIEWFKTTDIEGSKKLFAYYREMIEKAGVRRSYFVIPVKDSKLEKEVLKGEGFTVKLTESDHVIVTLSEISSMPLMKDRRVPDGILSIDEITVRKFRRGIARCAELGRLGVCEDLAYLPMGWFEKEVSCCVEKDDNIEGYLLFHKQPSGIIAIQLMVCLSKEFGVILPGMMRKFVNSMEKKYGPDTRILLDRHNETSLKLSEKLLPRGFGIPVYTGSRAE